MRKIRDMGGIVVAIAVLGAVGTVWAEDTASMTCEAYTDTAARVVTIDAINRRVVLSADRATPRGTYASICFPPDASAILLQQQSQLVIENRSGLSLLVENLFVEQWSATPCVGDGFTCGTVVLAGPSPIVLRNPRAVNQSGIAAFDGYAVRQDRATIEVTPERTSDPVYATGRQFRYGIILEYGNYAQLSRVAIQRSTALVGSVGVYLTAGYGHQVTDVRVAGAETAVVVTGGVLDAPNVILGGAFDGTTPSGALAHTGVFLRGDHVYQRSTQAHQLWLANYDTAIVLDPLGGPMGVDAADSGFITNTAVGISVRNAAMSIVPQLLLNVARYEDVQRTLELNTN